MNMKVHQTLVWLNLLSFRTKDLAEPTISIQSAATNHNTLLRHFDTSVPAVPAVTAILVCLTAARSRQDSWASSAKKIRLLEKKWGRKPATPQIIWKSAGKNFCYKFLGQFLPIIVKIRPQLGSLELGRFLGRWLPRPQEVYWAIFGSSGPEFGHLAAVQWCVCVWCVSCCRACMTSYHVAV